MQGGVVLRFDILAHLQMERTVDHHPLKLDQHLHQPQHAQQVITNPSLPPGQQPVMYISNTLPQTQQQQQQQPQLPQVGQQMMGLQQASYMTVNGMPHGSAMFYQQGGPQQMRAGSMYYTTQEQDM